MVWAVTVGQRAAGQQVLFFDDFSGSSLDMNLWKLPDPGPGSFLGRTQLRLSEVPQLVNGVARLRLDTYNGGSSFLGSEIMTRQIFERGGGLAFEARTRLVDPPPGLVGSVFTYQYNAPVRDEIDVELLSNEVQAGTQRVLTNAFNDAGFDSPGAWAFVSVPGLDLRQFNTYRVEWYPDAICWYVNGVLVRTERGVVPDSPTNVRLNFWAPASDFAAAYSAALQPARWPWQNQTFYYEADYVRVESLTGTFRNGGFELGALGWQMIGNNYIEDPPIISPLEGSYALKQFGTFDPYGPETTAVQSGVAVTAGTTYRLEAYVRVNASDSIAGTPNYEVMQIDFFTAEGQRIPEASVSMIVAEGSTPNDQWLVRWLDATAPEQAATMAVSFTFVQPALHSGAVFIDAVTVRALALNPVPGDLNADGFVDQMDVEILLSYWGQNVSAAMGNLDGRGRVDDFDLNILLGRWTGSSGSAVPEPMSLSVLSLLAVQAGGGSRRGGRRS